MVFYNEKQASNFIANSYMVNDVGWSYIENMCSTLFMYTKPCFYILSK
jgi:hypothetical protein